MNRAKFWIFQTELFATTAEEVCLPLQLCGFDTKIRKTWTSTLHGLKHCDEFHLHYLDRFAIGYEPAMVKSPSFANIQRGY